MIDTLNAEARLINEDSWHAWHLGRNREATAPTGPTALTATHWLHAEELKRAEEVPGLPGRWYLAGGGVVGIHLPVHYATTGTTQILPGEFLETGDLILTVVERLGERALRIYDRSASTRSNFRSIATFPPSARWQIPAHFEALPQTVNVTEADGVIVAIPTAGILRFTVEGRTHRLRVRVRDNALWATFSDTTADRGVHRFRFIAIDRPDAAGETLIDFNRAYLPPLAFSEHFLCAGPTQGNVLDFAVEAGEKWPVSD